MGFCLFNNVAVAAAHALAEGAVERVLILDWDVHHGNGTEAIFAGSDRVLYFSIHQSPLYPGTGPADYAGEAGGEGYTVNLPVPPGAGSAEFLSLVQHVVAPIARAFRPGLIAISAGYDAHRDDPLADCRVETDGYADMAATHAGGGGGARRSACSSAWRAATTRRRWRPRCWPRSRRSARSASRRVRPPIPPGPTSSASASAGRSADGSSSVAEPRTSR